MKQFIWILCGVFLSGMLLGTLSSCGADQSGMASITTDQPSKESSAPEDEAELDSVPVERKSPAGEDTVPAALGAGAEDEARRLAYGKALWNMYLLGILPDGTALDYLNTEAASMNNFTIADVDGDGGEELILVWTNAGVAGMREIVFGYRDGTVYEKLSEFPGLDFYDNGVVEADWSHNQGLGGRIWPYNLYLYDADSDAYEFTGAVDAWDISIRDTDYEGNPFPHDIDADGDGLVYYLLPAGWEGQYSAAAIVDGADHENWRNVYIDGAEKIELSFQPLTEETIAPLGSPRPQVEHPEPLG